MDFYDYRNKCAKYLIDNDLPISFEILPEQYGDFIGGCFKPWKVELDYQRCVDHHQKEIVEKIFSDEVTLIDAAKLTSPKLLNAAIEKKGHFNQHQLNEALSRLDIDKKDYIECLLYLINHGARFTDSNGKCLESLSSSIYFIYEKLNEIKK